MDQKPDAPQDPSAETSKPAQSGAAHVDLGKVLLPKKPAPGTTPGSAQRINAGALLEQEQKASLPKPGSAPQKPPAPKTPAPPATAQPETSMVPPLQTYKGDIESLIQSTNASTVSIAAAEAARRAQTPIAEPAKPFDWKGFFKRSAITIGGLGFLFAASGLLYFAYSYLNATVEVPQDAAAPFMSVDATTPLALPPGDLQRTTMMGILEAARQDNTLSLGLIGRLAVYKTIPDEEEDTYALLDAPNLLPILTPNIPADLLRTLTGEYLLGVHTYDGTQAFLLLGVDSYEHAFAGMLQWERAMRGDLLPLFNREPRPYIPEEGVATSSVGSVPQLIQTGFSDKIIENRDTRVILNTSGDILLLWAPLGPNLVVVTTNEYTLREIISRLGL